MATYSSEYEENLRRVIRDLKAFDPLITNIALTEKLSKRFNHSFDPRFIKRLSDKVGRQTLVELDRTTIEQRLKFTHENYRMVREKLCEIIYWNPDEHPGERKPANKDIIEAAKSIVILDIAVLHAEVSNGLFKKPIEAMAAEIRYEPVPTENVIRPGANA
jgi:hypothetical protein